MILYTQDEVEKYTRMLARAYEVIRDLALDLDGNGGRRDRMLKEIERTMGWNVPPPARATPPNQQERVAPAEYMFRRAGQGL